MTPVQLSKIVNVFSYLDESLLGQWQVRTPMKTGRRFLDIFIDADKGFVERLGVRQRFEDAGVHVRVLSSKYKKARWRLELPSYSDRLQVAKILWNAYTENSTGVRTEKSYQPGSLKIGY